MDVKITGTDIPLDEDLEKALIPVGQDVYRLARSLRPKALAEAHLPMGLGDFCTTIHRDPQTRRFSNTHLIHFHNALMAYEKFPILLEKVSATLEIHPDQRWEFREFRGSRRGGEFRVHGHNTHGETKDHVVIGIEGTNIDLDGDLRDALQPDLQKTWDALAPAGKIDFVGSLHFDIGPRQGSLDGEPLPDIELTVMPRACASVLNSSTVR